MNRDELLAAYAEGERNFSEAALRGAALRGADLSRANLRWASLRWANLSGASLAGADLAGADLAWASLRWANLSGASLAGADLAWANLREADLRGANLRGANLRWADLRGANLRNCRGLYRAWAPFLSSRHDALYAGAFERNGGLVLLFDAGCKSQLTADELRAQVRETHGENAHAVQYEAAIAFIEACYASDLAAGRFEEKVKSVAEAVS